MDLAWYAYITVHIQYIIISLITCIYDVGVPAPTVKS